jgi:hypothetical protein
VLLFCLVCGFEYAASGAHATLESRREEKALIRARRALVGVLLALASLLVIAVPAAVAQIEAANVVFHVALSGGDTGDPEGQGEAVLRFNPATGTLCAEGFGPLTSVPAVGHLEGRAERG